MTQQEAHERLVNDVAKAIAKVWSSENKNANLDQAAVLFSPSAEAAIALIVTRLGDVTPEMVEALDSAFDKGHITTWRAMLSASPLNGGKEK